MVIRLFFMQALKNRTNHPFFNAYPTTTAFIAKTQKHRQTKQALQTKKIPFPACFIILLEIISCFLLY